MKKSNPFGLLIHFERKTRLEPPLRVGIFLASLYLHPQPLRGASGVASCESSFCTTKKAVQWTAFDFERKTRLEPASRSINTRELFLHPQPLEGVFGVARGESCFPLHVKPPLSKGGLEGLYIWSRNLSAKRTKKG